MTHKKPKVLEIPKLPHYVDQIDRKRIDRRKRRGATRRRRLSSRGG